MKACWRSGAAPCGIRANPTLAPFVKRHRKPSHLTAEQQGEPLPAADAVVEAVTGPTTTWSAGVGFVSGQATRSRAPPVLTGLKGAMQTPDKRQVMRKPLELEGSRRRIAAEPGLSRNTLDRHLSLGEGLPP